MAKMVQWVSLDKLEHKVYRVLWVPLVKMVLLVLVEQRVKVEKEVSKEYKEILVLQVKRE